MVGMRNKTGVAIAFALGYYYGARAGEDRYEQLDRVLVAVRRSRPYRELRLALLETIEATRDRAVRLARDTATTSSTSTDPTVPMRLPFDDTLEMERPVDPSWN